VRRWPAPGDDAGTALVETVLVGPLVVLVLLVVFEGGLAWRDHTAASDAVSAAARSAALHPSSRVASGPAGLAVVVASVRDALATVPAASIERLVVFVPHGNATSALEAVPAGCRHGGTPSPLDRCVIVDPTQLAGGGPQPAAECPGGPEACLWRQPDGTAPGSSVSRVGIYLRLTRRWSIVGLGPAGTTEVAALAPLEAGHRVPA
jgi:hypothetical protein